MNRSHEPLMPGDIVREGTTCSLTIDPRNPPPSTARLQRTADFTKRRPRVGRIMKKPNGGIDPGGRGTHREMDLIGPKLSPIPMAFRTSRALAAVQAPRRSPTHHFRCLRFRHLR